MIYLFGCRERDGQLLLAWKRLQSNSGTKSKGEFTVFYFPKTLKSTSLKDYSGAMVVTVRFLDEFNWAPISYQFQLCSYAQLCCKKDNKCYNSYALLEDGEMLAQYPINWPENVERENTDQRK